jgi:O-antigen/teichoic acid export membrane protein
MRLAVNISANAAGRLWVAVLQLLLTPVIVRLLGPDSYGLVGFNATVSLFLAFLDQGVSPVLSRELARLAPNDNEGAQRARDLLRTSEAISCAIAALLGGAIIVAAPWLARHALAGGALPHDQVVMSIRLIGLGISTQWLGMLYSGAFMGLQRQDALVAVRLIGGTLSSVGGVLLLWLVTPSIELLLGWTAAVGLATSCALGVVLWRKMPAGTRKAKVEPRSIQRLWRFATGNLLIGLLGAVLSFGPGLIIAKYCTLAQLAAYTLSMSLAQQVTTLLTQPVTATLMPHFTGVFERRDDVALAREYHRWTQIIVALILPVAGTLIFFARPLITAWLGAKSPLIDPVTELLPWLVIGTVFNAFAIMTYILQVAYGWTRLVVKFNGCLIGVLLPLLLVLLPVYGIKAAAWLWVATNLSYYIVLAPLTHTQLIPDALSGWWLRDTALPTVAVATVFAASNSLRSPGAPDLVAFAQIVATAAISLALLIAMQPYLRLEAKRLIDAFSRRK